MTLRSVKRIQCDTHQGKGAPVVGYIDEYGVASTSGEQTLWYEVTLKATHETGITTLHICHECKRRLTEDKP